MRGSIERYVVIKIGTSTTEVNSNLQTYSSSILEAQAGLELAKVSTLRIQKMNRKMTGI
jgi:hypothetical protein